MPLRGSLQVPLQILPGERLLFLRDRLWRPFGNNGAACFTATRPHIDDPVSAFDHIEVVFDHDERIALVPEAVKNLQQGGDIGEALLATGRPYLFGILSLVIPVVGFGILIRFIQ